MTHPPIHPQAPWDKGVTDATTPSKGTTTDIRTVEVEGGDITEEEGDVWPGEGGDLPTARICVPTLALASCLHHRTIAAPKDTLSSPLFMVYPTSYPPTQEQGTISTEVRGRN